MSRTGSRCSTRGASTPWELRPRSSPPAIRPCGSSSRGAPKGRSFPREAPGMNHTSRRAAIQVGVTGLVALALLLIGIAWVKDYRLGKKKQLLVARFEEVGNLSEGDPVSVRGVKKGAMTEVHLKDQTVQVTFELERDVVLHPDAVIHIANIGFMGEKFLALDPGSEPGR